MYYFTFGGDNLLIFGLFVLTSITIVIVGFSIFYMSIKILLVLKQIKEYIKRRGDK